MCLCCGGDQEEAVRTNKVRVSRLRNSFDINQYIDGDGRIDPGKVSDKPISNAFTPDNFVFASSETGSFTVDGSLYFNGGRRIRMRHGSGPAIEGPDSSMKRYCVTDDGAKIYDDRIDDYIYNGFNLGGYLENKGHLKPVEPNKGGRLLEITDEGMHLSRGRPITAVLSQRQINFLYIAAQTKDNGIIVDAWGLAGL